MKDLPRSVELSMPVYYKADPGYQDRNRKQNTWKAVEEYFGCGEG